MIRSGLLMASWIAIAFAQSDGNQCGTYFANCVPIGGAEFVTINMTVFGIKSNDATIEYTIYRDANCVNAELSVVYSALYTDLGAGLPKEEARGWQVNALKIDVTPLSNDAVSKLQDACPCSLTWALNETQGLVQCDKAQCSDLTWLGADAKDNGLVIGAPFYGWTVVTSNTMTMSRLVASKDAIGQVTNTFVDMTTVDQCDPTIDYDTAYCGTWLQGCYPNDDDTVLAYSSEFSYTGPESDADGRSATYMYERDYFVDLACAQPYLKWEEEGTMAVSDGQQPNVDVLEKNPLSVMVTPQSQAAVDMLNNKCKCGLTAPWTINGPRVLTTCLEGTCDTSLWYDNAPIGTQLSAVAQKALRQGDALAQAELRIGAFTQDADSVQNSSIPVDAYSFLFASEECLYNQPFHGDICGTWETGCAADLGNFDTSSMVEVRGEIGDEPLQGSGRISITRTTFQPGQSCALTARTLETMKVGYFSDYGNDTLVYQNSRQIYFQNTELVVVAYSDDMVTDLNNACPCNGTWQKEISRTLTTCPPNTCNEASAFGGGVLGQPGFGVITLEAGQLRLTDFKDNVVDGFLQTIGLEVYPHDYQGTCIVPTDVEEPFGIHVQPCQPDALEVSPFHSAGNWTIYADNSYEWYRGKYTAGSNDGCRTNLALMVKTLGHIELTNENNIRHVHITTDVFEITPYTQEAVQLLNNNCNCGITWKINITANIQGTCNCASTSFLQQNIGPDSYGTAIVTDLALTVSDLVATSKGYGNQVTNANRNYILQAEAPLPAGSNGKKKLSGGEVFLILVFVTALVYVVGGMIINYRASGTPAIPHAEFWGVLPGYISDGIFFSCCQCFGMRGTGGGYSSMATEEHGSTNSGGYGAV